MFQKHKKSLSLLKESNLRQSAEGEAWLLQVDGEEKGDGRQPGSPG